MRRALGAWIAALLLVPLPLAGGEAAGSEVSAVDGIEDFRGIRFGADVADRRDLMEIRREGDIVVYERKGDHLTYGQARLVGLLYTTYRGRLYQVGLLFQGQDNHTHALKALSDRYGRPKVRRIRRPPLETYEWKGLTMRVSLVMSQEGGLVTFSRKDLDAQAEAHLQAQREGGGV